MDKTPYTIRYSEKAQSLQLRISAKGLEVVIPKKLRNLSQSKVDEFIRLKQSWIDKHHQHLFAIPKEIALPQVISLKSLDQDWQVHYENRDLAKSTLHADVDRKRLYIHGNMTQIATCLQLLRAWLSQLANVYLPIWLSEISLVSGLSYHKVSIRNNKTRWGSCSSDKKISLSCQLLFLPHKYVKHIILHELCHTKKMHHGHAFWALLQKYDPDAINHAKEVRRLSKTIPAWVKD